MTPEDRERSSPTGERLSRWPRLQDLERERMNGVWSRLEKEQAALFDTRDALLKLAGKGMTDLWRLKQRMECIMAGLKDKLCEACSDETRSRDRREEEARRWP